MKVTFFLLSILGLAIGENKCGTSYATSACGLNCPRGIDSECPSGQRCFADPPVCQNPGVPTESPTPFPTSVSGGQTCQVGKNDGLCKDVRACNGINVAGYCPGPSSQQCCVLESSSTTVFHLPQAPNADGNLGTCKSLQNDFEGVCISTSACTGATFNDVCPGSSSIKCCVTEIEPVPDLLLDETLSKEVDHLDLLSYSVFRSIFTGISAARAAALFPYYNYGLAEVLMDAVSRSESCYRSAAFAAQVGYESGGLLYFEEIASGEAYEGREELGNVYPGDGPRYKGRGPIQLTGRYNYQQASARLGEDLEGVPDRVCFPNMGFLTTVDYWMSRNLNRFAGTSSEQQFETLTKYINGGYNGLEGRKSRWYAARELLGCDNLVNEDLNTSAVPVQKFMGGSLIMVALCFLAGALYYLARKEPDSPEQYVVAQEIVNDAGGRKAKNPMYL